MDILPTQPQPRWKSTLLLLHPANVKNLKLLPAKLNKTERWLVLGAIVLLVGGLAAWIFFFVRSPRVPAYGGKYSEGIVGEPKFINPLYNETTDADQDLSAVVFSSLIKVTSDKQIIGDLAESWTISEDGKTYTLKLRPNVKWHDGENFNANDVLFTVAAIQNPDYSSPLRRNLKGIEVSAPDEGTIQFKLLEPFSPFLSTLTFGILPAHIWESVPAASAAVVEQNRKPIGTGPYKFDQLTKRKDTGELVSYTVKAFDDYYAGRPYIDQITFRFYQDSNELIDALNKGQVDSAHFATSSDASRITTDTVTVHNLELPAYTALFINGDNSVILRERDIRRALAHGTNKQQLVDEVLGGHGAVSEWPLLPGFVGYDSSLPKYEYDPTKARSIIEAMGWQKGDDGIYKKGNDRLSFVLDTTDWEQNAQTAELLAAQWKEIGVELTPELQSVSETQQNSIKQRSYDILLFSQSLGADSDLYPYWHTSQAGDPGLNLTAFRFKDVDKLIQQARQTSDTAKRADLYKQIQTKIIEEEPAIFLYSQQYAYPLANKIQGFDATRLTVPADRLATVNKWYIKTTHSR